MSLTWAFFSVVCGSWFDHFLSWEEHEDEKNILFLFYEDMKKVNMLSALILECLTCKLTSLKYQRANYNEEGEIKCECMSLGKFYIHMELYISELILTAQVI